MSLQREILNATLKSLVKPVLHGVPFTRPMLALSRPYLDLMGTVLLRAPSSVIIKPTRTGRMSAEWIIPKVLAHEERVLLYFHGGGYLTGSPKTHRPITGRIAAFGQMRVLAINYRKAPEHPFPAPLEDAITAYEHLLALGFKPQNIMLAGDSAGGHLTLSTLIALRDKGHDKPRAGICLSPWTDLTMSGHSMHANRLNEAMLPVSKIKTCIKHVSGKLHPADPRLTLLNANLEGLPPLLIHVGDTEVLRSDSERLAEKAKSHGVPVQLKLWKSMPHVFHLFADYVPQSSKALFEIGQFIVDQFNEVSHHPKVVPLHTPRPAYNQAM